MPERIAVVGPESTGKTTLARALAARLGVPWVPEHARDLLPTLGRPYREEDLVEVARGQLAAERAALDEARATGAPLVICDTNLLVVRIWAEVRYGRVDPWITAHEDLHGYALHLLPAPDLPWEADPLREHPHARDALFARYEAALREAGVPWGEVRGSGEARTEAAVRVILAGGWWGGGL